MGFKNDSQRKAVMATLNNGASTRGISTASLRKVRFNQANSNSVTLIGKKLSIPQTSVEYNGKTYVFPKKEIEVRPYDTYLRSQWGLSTHNMTQLKKHGEFNIRDKYGSRTIHSDELKKAYKDSLKQKIGDSYGHVILKDLLSKGVDIRNSINIREKVFSQLDIKNLV